ncbi:MAG: TIGR03087 family PEP-CTERM/XrtA system glycosyltransferase [Duganella sp.]
MRDLPHVLFLTHRIPYPPNKGDKIRAHHVLRYLQQHFQVHLGTFIDQPDDARHAAPLAAGCAGSCMIALSPRHARLRSLAALADGEALSVRYYRNPTLQHWVARTLDRYPVTVALALSGPMAQYLPPHTAHGPLRRVMDLVDVDSEKWRAYAADARWPHSRVYQREAHRLLAYERQVAQEFDHTVLVSAQEADLLRRLAPESAHRIDYYNMGVDCAFFSPARQCDNPYPAGAHLVFTGALDYRPNREAVAWFAQQVMPALRSARADLVFHIVGARPDARVLALQRLPGVMVHPDVPDVRPYLHHAALAVAPLFLARGVQSKVLEAMAMQKTVVVTPQAAEGISAVAGAELLVAADRQGFIDTVVQALAAPAAPAAIGLAARQRVLRDYRWDHSLARLGRLLQVPADAEHSA